MARGMHKGPRNTRSDERFGVKREGLMKTGKTTLEKRQTHWDAKGAKTQHNRPGSNKK